MRHVLFAASALALFCASCMPAPKSAGSPMGGVSGSGAGKDTGAGAATPDGAVRIGTIAMGEAVADGTPPPDVAPDKPAKTMASAAAESPPPPNETESAPGGGGHTTTKNLGGKQKGSSGGGTGTLQAAVVDSGSGLSEADIRNTIAKKSGTFQSCYSIGVASSADFAGAVTVRASIGPTGVVANIDVVSSTTKNARVDSCVVDALRLVQFPATGSGGIASIPVEFGR